MGEKKPGAALRWSRPPAGVGRGLPAPEPVQQIRLALVEGQPLPPARSIAAGVIRVSVPAGRVAGFRVDRPVAALDALLDHPGHEGVLPLLVHRARDVAPAILV